MSNPNQPVIIIRRKKKGGHAGHHGGAWKVAYADFVTAMMSFFLLMWLLNVTTSDQRKGIADYFAPTSVSQSSGGSGGVMGGMTIMSPSGADMSASSPPGVDERTTATVCKGDQGVEDVSGKAEKTPEQIKAEQAAAEPPKTPAEELAQDAAALAEAMKREEGKFKEAEAMLKQAISNAPGLQDIAQQLIIDRTPEGLRIQIIDKDRFSLFPSGSSIPYEKGRDLLRLVGKVVSYLPNQISITGHTDSNPFPAGSRRDNWDLSAERANLSRTELVTGGVGQDRIARVVGLADKDPFVKNDTKDARNRRISIVLLRQSTAAEGAKPETPQAAPVATKVVPSKP